VASAGANRNSREIVASPLQVELNAELQHPLSAESAYLETNRYLALRPGFGKLLVRARVKKRGRLFKRVCVRAEADFASQCRFEVGASSGLSEST
jgi:hypothetical protein